MTFLVMCVKIYILNFKTKSPSCTIAKIVKYNALFLNISLWLKLKSVVFVKFEYADTASQLGFSLLDIIHPQSNASIN